MTRADLVAHLDAWHSELLADAELDAADTVGNLKEPIDAALRAMGVTAADLATATPTDEDGFIAQGEYHVLRRIVRALSTRFDVGIDGDSYRLSQSVAHARALLNEAEARVLALFGAIHGADEGPKQVRIVTPFLAREPHELAVW